MMLKINRVPISLGRMVLLALAAGLIVACADAGAGGGGGGSANIDYEVTFDSGSASIEGTVTFASAPQSGRALALTVQKTTPGNTYTEFDSTFTANGSGSMTYRITNISDGTYRVRIPVDVDGNSTLSDTGDLDGWYAGTTGSPITSSAGATTITVSGGSSTGNDFGIGPRS